MFFKQNLESLTNAKTNIQRYYIAHIKISLKCVRVVIQ